MATIWMALRAEARTRWRAWLALALVLGLASGGAIAAIAGARRTDTAYPRFERAQDAFDVVTGGGGSHGFETRFEALKKHRMVKEYVELVTVGAEITIPAKSGRRERVIGFPEAFLVADPTGRGLYDISRAKVLAGRLPDRQRVDETTIPFGLADRYGIEVGDRIVAGVGFDSQNARPGSFPPPLEHIPLRVVGIHAAPGDFEAVGQTTFTTIYATPALEEKYREILPPPNPDTWSLGIKLKGGPKQATAFKRTVEHDLNLDVPFMEPVIRTGVQKTIRLYAVALWLLGSLIALATVAIVGQTLARQQALESADYPTLRSLGMSRRQLLGLGLLRATLTGVVAAALATVAAYVLSPLTPIGPARIAEPAPGLAFDPTAIGLGAAVVLLIVPLITLIPSLRAARSAESLEPAISRIERPSWIVQRASRASNSPATTAGLRMALEPGRGRTAVPVRSTILAVALGIAAVTASVTVGRSLVHLIDTPALTGFTYDAILPGGEFEPSNTTSGQDLTRRSTEERVAQLRQLPFVGKVALGTAVNVVIGGNDSFLLAFNEGGEIGYAMIDGRAPTDATQRGLPEMAVGPATMRRLGLHIGGTVAFGYPDPSQEEEELEQDVITRRLPTQRAVIVGVAAIPPVPWAATEPGEGAMMSAGSVERFKLGDPGGCCFVSFKPGTDLSAARARLEDAGFETSLRTKRSDLVTLERISRLPAVLSLVFAAIAAAALAHVLVTAVRRHRRDLAILKTLGFVKRQVRGAIAWQVSTIAVLSLAVGIPAGVALGRWSWGLIAAQFGVVPVPVAPVALIALLLPAALVLGNLVAALPGRSAARTQPALVLRTE